MEDVTIRIEIEQDTPHLKKLHLGTCNEETCRTATWNSELSEMTFTHYQSGKAVASVTLSLQEFELVATFLEHIIPDIEGAEEELKVS